MKFGDNLKKLRKSKNISQEVLAEKVSVSRQSVSKWETGEAYPEMNNILTLCNIFHCKINDLVNDSMIDIDSLDEEIKMNVVKFEKKKQSQMKVLSKIIYIFAKIGRIATNIGAWTLIFLMAFLPFFALNTKVNKDSIEIFNEKVEYKKYDDKLEMEYKSNKYTVNDLDDKVVIEKVIETYEENSIIKVIGFLETALILLVANLILISLTLKHLEKLFINIHNGETPFNMENVNHIKRMAIYMISTIILPSISAVIVELVVNVNINEQFQMFDVIYILFLFSMAYIFEYGYQIQLDSKGKMYDDEK